MIKSVFVYPFKFLFECIELAIAMPFLLFGVIQNFTADLENLENIGEIALHLFAVSQLEWFDVDGKNLFIYPRLMQLYAGIDRMVGNGDYASNFGAWMFGLSSPLVFVDGIIFPLS